MLRVINLQGTTAADATNDSIKFEDHGSLPILDFGTPSSRDQQCRYCRQGSTLLTPLMWICCCDAFRRYAHEDCLKGAISSSIREISSDSSIEDHDWRRC